MKGTQIDIPVSGRKTGKHVSRQLRMQGRVPGVLYGNKKEPVQLQAEEKLIKKFSGSAFENAIFNVVTTDLKGLDKTPVLLKAVDVHPLTRRPVHFDLLAIDMNKTVRVSVELRYEGKAAGIAEGGMLQPLLRVLDIECLPKDIPEFITVDVSPLGVHQTLHISEIQLPNGVKATANEDLALVTVTVVAEEEIKAPEAAAAAATTAEPEVIKKGKQEEGGAEAKPEKK